MMIDGFGVANYRSFGGSLQKFAPLGKVNLVIGQNNSGKSNVLRLASEHLPGLMQAVLRDATYGGFKPIDRHIGPNSGVEVFAIGFHHAGAELDASRELIQHTQTRRILDKLLAHESFVQDGVAWFHYTPGAGSRWLISPEQVNQLEQARVLDTTEWNKLWNALTRMQGGNLRDWIPQTLQKLVSMNRGVPKTAFVPAIREVQRGAAQPDHSGRGLIETLAKLERPGYNEQGLKARFEEINTFLRDVTGSESARIEIPADRDTILAHLDGRTLPLESLGTGIHEVIILAAAATALSNHLVCIEEPEIHLHPLLQRKLLAYLQKATSNQYLIATHSGHLLDTETANILHVRLHEGCSVVKSAVTPIDKFSVCVDLGYRASDLLQANCVIWVEGPSDRVYLRYWLRQVAPELIEGVHYSAMFYGGRLLSHLTANDPEVEEFISLRRLNRFIAILIDSDRSTPHSRLNETKRRVRDEFDKGPGFAWITAGREIENYLPENLVEAAVRGVHKDVKRISARGRFAKALEFVSSKNISKTADKVKVACRVVQSSPPTDILDLRNQLRRTVEFIKLANHL